MLLQTALVFPVGRVSFPGRAPSTHAQHVVP